MLTMLNILNPSWWKFEWQYWRHRTPWDTNITPPEVMDFIASHPPGRALDLGCGTGTNAITLAQRGWRATGVDFSVKAIRTARRKAAKADLAIDFRTGDVADLEGLDGPYDYALDIGCLFTLKPEGRKNYTRGLARLLVPQGVYMLYAWLPRPWKGQTWGMSPEEVESLLRRDFAHIKTVTGEEKGSPSAWYWYERL